MNRQVRLARMEQAAGIGTPCEWCAYWAEQQRIFVEALAAQGVKLHQPKTGDLKRSVCSDCGITKIYDQTFLTKADRREWKALLDEEEREMAADREASADWWRRYLAAVDQEEEGMRKFYGEAFDIARKETDHELFRQEVLRMIEKAEQNEDANL